METLVNKQVTLLGANHDVDPAGGLDRGGESVIVWQVTITADGATVNGFKLSGKRIYINGADDVLVSYNIVVDSSMHGTRLDPSSPNAQILYNTISSPEWEGICNYVGNSDVTISYNHITDVTDQHAIVSGMHVGTNIQITYNVISDCTGSKGINYWGGPSAVISYNKIFNTGWEAIFTDTEATIEGNVISNSDNNGINLYPVADNSIVRENTISNCQYTGINVLADKVSVEDNIISNCGGDGVWVDAEDVSVKGNLISYITYAGINVRANANDVFVTENTISGCGTGVDVVGTVTGTIINFNNIYGNGMGVANYCSTDVIDATYNWWGHASGPSGADGRTTKKGKEIGKGDAVSANVDWDPWLPQPVGHTPHDPVPPGLK